MVDISVKKRSGETEAFSFDKLLASIGKTGIPITQSMEIATQIENWVRSKDNNIISSNQIRDKVIELLSEDFPAEADSYKAYKK